jgi:universal stress protein E
VSRKIRRILVAIRDVDRVPPSQLRKAATIARATGARVELFHANGEPLIPESLRRSEGIGVFGRNIELVAEKSLRRLARLRDSRIFAGLKVESRMVRDYPPHEAVVRRVLAVGADLVVAASQRHHLAGRLFLLNTDWELIRYCPCPILFVKSRGDYRKPTVLTGVDPFHYNAKPANLDRHLLRSAAALTRVLRGELHVCHAYLPLAMSLITALEQAPLWLPPEAEDANTARVARAFNHLAENAGLPRRRRHLSMGDVPTVLLATARQIGANVVVMGAVSRSGLKRLFIGSTAERVLDELRCDVLIIKPQGFKAARSKVRSPVLGKTLYL